MSDIHNCKGLQCTICFPVTNPFTTGYLGGQVSTVNISVYCGACGGFKAPPNQPIRYAGPICQCHWQTAPNNNPWQGTAIGWECPKYHNCYNPTVLDCKKCNV